MLEASTCVILPKFLLLYLYNCLPVLSNFTSSLSLTAYTLHWLSVVKKSASAAILARSLYFSCEKEEKEMKRNMKRRFRICPPKLQLLFHSGVRVFKY